VLVGVSAWVVWSARHRPHLVVGWFWFLGMLVPMIGLIQAGAQEMADRYMYLPLIGLSVAVVWELADRLSPWRHARQALIGLGTAVLLACAIVTSIQLGYWRNTESLFQHALEVTGDNYMAHNNLAADCYLHDDFNGAIEHYEASLANAPTQPSEPQIRFYLGDALSKRGRYDEAAQQFTEVLTVRPNDVSTRVQLGITRARQGRNEEARQAFLEALRIAPNDPAALDNFGNLLAQQGRYAEAVQQFEVSLKAKPDNAAAHNNIAISLAKLNRLGDAISHYREAIRLQPDFLPPLNNLAWILAASPHAEFRNGAEAVRLATAGCETTKYQNPMLLTTLAAAYGEVGQFPEAISFAERAQGLAQGNGGPLSGRLAAMLESFRANRAYHAD
jgi:protein O-mannosyl-transferase